MNKFIIGFIWLVIGIKSYSQVELDYGIKGGVNYSSHGDLSVFTNKIYKINSNNEIGFNFGVYSRFNFKKFYLAPELLITKVKSSYNSEVSESGKFKQTTIDFPILFGYEIFEPFSIYVGPYANYIIDSGFDDTPFDLEFDKKFVLGLNFGAGIQIHKLGLDLRYNTGLSKNEATHFQNGTGLTIDSKSKQLILSVSFQIN